MSQKLTDLDIIVALERHKSHRRAADALGLPKSTFQDWLGKALKRTYTTRRQPAPLVIEPAQGTRYTIFTSAQDRSQVHQGFLTNLETYAAELGAKIYIAGYTYNKKLFEDQTVQRAVFQPEIRKYLTDKRIEIADGLEFCGEMNTLPTAVTPLTGFETYTRSKWGIFPHPKVQLHSVPTMQHEPAKILQTTGTVTLPNYVQKKAGIKAEFHHIIGALLVEIDSSGRFWCRHLLAEDDGSFYDLDRYVTRGKITTGHRLLSLVPGDIHHEKLDIKVARATFGLSGYPDRIGGYKKNLYDTLRPEHIFLHDLSDFTPRNHHNIADHHFKYDAWARGEDSVESALNNCADFLNKIERPWCQRHVVESNHDLALLKWLKTADYRQDPPNALFFLKAQTAQYEALSARDSDFSIFEWSVRRSGIDLGNTIFAREDQKFPLHEIEHYLHGHSGANGAQPSPMQFTKMGPKTTMAHTHTACIRDGYMSAGVSGSLRMGYNNAGLSSWSHSHVGLYQNGKRVMITLNDNLWCAEH